jgi:hypothetical protein
MFIAVEVFDEPRSVGAPRIITTMSLRWSEDDEEVPAINMLLLRSKDGAELFRCFSRCRQEKSSHSSPGILHAMAPVSERLSGYSPA